MPNKYLDFSARKKQRTSQKVEISQILRLRKERVYKEKNI